MGGGGSGMNTNRHTCVSAGAAGALRPLIRGRMSWTAELSWAESSGLSRRCHSASVKGQFQ